MLLIISRICKLFSFHFLFGRANARDIAISHRHTLLLQIALIYKEQIEIDHGNSSGEEETEDDENG